MITLSTEMTVERFNPNTDNFEPLPVVVKCNAEKIDAQDPFICGCRVYDLWVEQPKGLALSILEQEDAMRVFEERT